MHAPPPAPPDRRLAGIGLRLVAVFFLALMFSMAKLANARGVSLIENIYYRQAFALPLVVGWVMLGPGLASVRTQRPGAHVIRAVVGMAAMTVNFLSYMLLPLAEATTLGFAVPIFATILAALFLGERTRWHRWSAVIVGFAGVLIVVQPGGSVIPPLGAAVGIAAAIGVACTSLLIRQLGRTEGAATTVFWFTVISTVPMTLALPLFWQDHDATTWGILGLVGLSGGAAQLALTGALRLAPISVVLPMDYSNLIWATLFGWLLFDQLPVESTWLGAPIIIASGLYIIWREHRLQRERTAVAMTAD